MPPKAAAPAPIPGQVANPPANIYNANDDPALGFPLLTHWLPPLVAHAPPNSPNHPRVSAGGPMFEVRQCKMSHVGVDAISYVVDANAIRDRTACNKKRAAEWDKDGFGVQDAAILAFIGANLGLAGIPIGEVLTCPPNTLGQPSARMVLLINPPAFVRLPSAQLAALHVAHHHTLSNQLAELGNTYTNALHECYVPYSTTPVGWPPAQAVPSPAQARSIAFSLPTGPREPTGWPLEEAAYVIMKAALANFTHISKNILESRLRVQRVVFVVPPAASGSRSGQMTHAWRVAWQRLMVPRGAMPGFARNAGNHKVGLGARG